MIPSTVRILVSIEPLDMRLGFDRLAAAARSRLGVDPQQGDVLVAFANRGATRLKLLWFDRNGYCLLYKRLHRALFELPRPADARGVAVRLDGRGLATLLAGVERPPARQRHPRENRARTPMVSLAPAR